METREQALHRILAEAGAELSEDDRRELVAHLDDAVDLRVRAGEPEDRAIASAVAELGDLRRIAGALQGTRLAEVKRRVNSRLAFTMIVYFAAMQFFMAPRCVRIFDKLHLPMPAVLAGFVALAEAMWAAWPLVLVALAGLGWLFLRTRRVPEAAGGTVALGALLALALFAASVCLPILNWEEIQQLPQFAPR